MEFKLKIVPQDNREDYFNVSLSNYKNSRADLEDKIGGMFEGKMERGELRHLIELIDNAITVGLDSDEQYK